MAGDIPISIKHHWLVVLLKEFGFPAVMVVGLGYFIWDENAWIRTTLTDLLSENTAALVGVENALEGHTKAIDESVVTSQENKLVLEKIAGHLED